MTTGDCDHKRQKMRVLTLPAAPSRLREVECLASAVPAVESLRFKADLSDAYEGFGRGEHIRLNHNHPGQSMFAGHTSRCSHERYRAIRRPLLQRAKQDSMTHHNTQATRPTSEAHLRMREIRGGSGLIPATQEFCALAVRTVDVWRAASSRYDPPRPRTR